MAPEPPAKNIYEAMAAHGSFQALLASVKLAGLAEALQSPGPWTFFAPTDAAFAKLARRDMDQFLRSPENLTALISFHILPGALTLEEIKGMHLREEVQGKRFAVNRGRIQVNGVRVNDGYVRCGNGIIHPIDAVLLPDKIGIS